MHGDSNHLALPNRENEMSRRYLTTITRWVPVAKRYWNEWPDRPNCGHFFGGVHWYGQETSMPIVTLALAASSPEFDAQVAGVTADQLRQIALQGLRYLCFTHDTGPADCFRPRVGLGRPEPAGTKWGERGRGFFPESQCGGTVASLALTAALLGDLLGDEERAMLGNIAEDYLARFGEMEPRSGVYFDTQTEENAWTALGLVASLLLLNAYRGDQAPPDPKQRAHWWEQAKLWMFRTLTVPRDQYDYAEFAGGRTVRELCSRTYTTLPDGTAENHGFVHPSYMASAANQSGTTLNLLNVYRHEIPPHLFWHRKDTYDLLKRWCDRTGAPQPVQGMDWPYFSHPGHTYYHAIANLYLGDPDAALLERRALEIVERSTALHGGQIVPQEAIERGHGPQDPTVMRERAAVGLARAYLTHRLLGPGETPSDAADFERRMQGVHLYPHGGFVLHRHARGQTSLAWRNRTMVLPATREGQKLIGPASGSMLAEIVVRGRPANTTPVSLKVREQEDCVSVALVQDLAQGSVRRRVLFASLPNGKCLVYERLAARQNIVVESVRQGYLSVINDGLLSHREDLRGKRQVYWPRGKQVFYGSYSGQEDMTLDLERAGWVNVDDRCGLVYRGSGRALYRNRHSFAVFRAVEDDLVLSLQDTPQAYSSGQEIAKLIVLWCPEQPHQETAEQGLLIHDTPENAFAAEVDGYLCACNLGTEAIQLPVAPTVCGGALYLDRGQPAIVKLEQPLYQAC
jgi:hypothetical protein